MESDAARLFCFIEPETQRPTWNSAGLCYPGGWRAPESKKGENHGELQTPCQSRLILQRERAVKKKLDPP
jgi:hypothetical protein